MTRILLYIDMSNFKRNIVLFLALALLLPSLLFTGCGKSQTKYTAYFYEYFDTVIQIIGYEDSEEDFNRVVDDIEKEISYYHELFDIYYKYSGVNNIALLNDKAAKEEIKVDPELTRFLIYCKDMYDKTDGKVNIAMGSVLKIWNKYREKALDEPENAAIPSKAELIDASQHTDINKLIIDSENNTVYYEDKRLKLDVGAVAKGYTTELIYDKLKEKGKENYLLNLGGNIKTLGKSNDKAWLAGIENPDKLSMESIIEYIELTDMALVTSGSYQRYYMYEGKRYCHIIDESTLFPADNYLSVSVITDDSALGDVLSTTLFIISIEDGKALLKEFGNAEAMWVNKDGTKVYSDNFSDYIKK